MALKPEASVMSGLAVAGIVYSIHSNFTPTIADMQGLPAGTKDVDSAERKATWLSVGVVAGVSLLAKDPTIFVMGSAMTVAMAFFSRHATWTESASGLIGVGSAASPALSTANELSEGPAATAVAPYQMFGSEFVSS